jgi:enoyl-CoA hydratase
MSVSADRPDRPAAVGVRDLESGVRLLTFSRPEKHNALRGSDAAAMAAALRIARLDESVAGVVIAGEGASFAAGVDLHEFSEGDPESGERMIRSLRTLCADIRKHPKPVAAAVHGQCLGGALEVAACCDFRAVAHDAQFAMPEVALGIPSVIDAVLLGHLIGVGRARELLLTGDPISGDTALTWGLATRAVPASDVIESAAELVRRTARHDPVAVAVQKRLNDEWLDLTYEAAVERSIEALVDAFRAGRPQRYAADRLRARTRA